MIAGAERVGHPARSGPALVSPLTSRTPLLGRDAELAVLRAARKRACAGRGGTVVVTGPPGIGKTRLTAELTSRHAADGGVVLQARGTPDPGAPELWPWIQVARQCGRLIPEVEQADLSGHPGSSFAFYETIVAQIDALARERCVVVVIEDAHWAHTASLRLLDMLARSAGHAALLVLVTHRDVEPSRNLASATVLAGIAREGVRLELSGLSDADTAALLARGGYPASAAQAAEVRRLTGGNPQLIRQVGGGGSGAVEDWSGELIAERLVTILDEDVRAVLSTAAIMGVEFTEGVLDDVHRGERPRLHRVLMSLRERGFLAPAADGRWAFTDPRLRNALLDRLHPAQAADLHRRVGSALRATATTRPVPAGEIAAHFLAAARHGPVGPAADLCRAAAVEATDQDDVERAVRWLEEAVALAERDPATTDAARLDLLLALGQVQTRMSHTRAAGIFGRARHIASEIGDVSGLARATLGGAEAHQHGPGSDNTVDGEAALLDSVVTAMADRAREDPTLTARLLAASARAHALAYQPADADARAAECAELARETDDVGVRHAAVVARRWAAPWSAASRTKRELTGHLVLHAAQMGDIEEQCTAQHWRMGDGLEAGDPDVVNSAVSMTATLAAQLDAPDPRYHSYVQQATVALLEGRFDDVRTLHRLAGEQHPAADGPDLLIYGQRVFLDWQAGTLDPALVRAIGEAVPPALAQALVCWGSVAGDDAGAVAAELDRFFADVAVDRLPDGNFLPAILAAVSEAVAHTGDKRYAAQVHSRLLPFADRCVVIGSRARIWHGSCRLYLGMLATVLGEVAEAERHLDAADLVHRRMGARCHLIRARLWRARLAMTRGADADVRTLLETTLRDAERLGMGTTAAHAREDLVRLDQPSALSSDRWVLRRNGALWEVGTPAATGLLPDRKGLRYVRTLLQRPGSEVHVLDLAGAGVLRGRTGTGPLLDAAAKAAYRRRIEDLRELISDGEEWGDALRAATARDELDALTQHLAAAVSVVFDFPADAENLTLVLNREDGSDSARIPVKVDELPPCCGE